MKNVLNTLKMWVKNHTKTAIATAMAVVAVIALTVAGATGAFFGKTTHTPIKNDGSSLKKEAGKDISKKAETNTKASDSLSNDTKDAIAESTNKEEKSAKSESKPSKTVDSDSKSKSAAPSDNNSSKSDSKPSKKDKIWVEEKGHWEYNMEQVWVPNIVTVVDREAYDEEVNTGEVYYVCSDGYIAYSDADLKTHEIAMIKAGTPISYSVQVKTTTVHHDAVTHTEDQGHYEAKSTGPKWVVDKPGHWE